PGRPERQRAVKHPAPPHHRRDTERRRHAHRLRDAREFGPTDGQRVAGAPVGEQLEAPARRPIAARAAREHHRLTVERRRVAGPERARRHGPRERVARRRQLGGRDVQHHRAAQSRRHRRTPGTAKAAHAFAGRLYRPIASRGDEGTLKRERGAWRRHRRRSLRGRRRLLGRSLSSGGLFLCGLFLGRLLFLRSLFLCRLFLGRLLLLGHWALLTSSCSSSPPSSAPSSCPPSCPPSSSPSSWSPWSVPPYVRVSLNTTFAHVEHYVNQIKQSVV